MKDGNIYTDNSFVQLIDKLLLERKEFITYNDVISSYVGREWTSKNSSSPFYRPIVKAVNEIKTYLEKEKNMCFVYKVGDTAEEGFMYPNGADPLADLRKKQIVLCRQELRDFCINSMGLLPEEWTKFFLNGTQMLIENKNRKETGRDIISADRNSMLHNISVLPKMYNAITDKHVLEINYLSGYSHLHLLKFHPHFLKEYNNRWFAIGYAVCEDGEIRDHQVCGLDRICSDIVILEDEEYISAPIGTYNTFFHDIIGVTHISGEEMMNVVIHTMTEHVHNRIITKPLHISQKEVTPFDKTNGYGAISLDVKYNKELLSLLLSYGSKIRIASPQYLIEKIKAEVINFKEMYQI